MKIRPEHAHGHPIRNTRPLLSPPSRPSQPGDGADLLETAQQDSSFGNSRAPVCLDHYIPGVLLSWQRRWPEVIANLRSRRSALFCFGSGVMVSVNWLLFIWAVTLAASSKLVWGIL